MFSGKTNSARKWKTIGFKLTLWGSSITLLVCALACVLLYVAVYFSLRHEVDRFLKGEMNEFLAVLDQHSWELTEAQHEIRIQLGSRSEADLNFRLLGPDNTVLLSASPIDAGPTDVAGISLENHDVEHPHFWTTPEKEAHRAFRICSASINRPDGTYVVQTSYALDLVSASLNRLKLLCLLVMVVAAILSLVGGRVLSRRSLAPLDRMIASARQISTSRLSERLPRSHNDDELDQLAQTLNQFLERVEKYILQMQQFTADASHELRTPLAALRGNAEVALTRHRSVEELKIVLEDSIEHYDRLAKIADDLLMLARADIGSLTLRRETIELEKAVGDVIDLFAPLASEQGVELTFDGGGEIWVDADGSLIRQLISNLIDNGIAYAGSGKRVQVSASQKNGTAIITVSDNGTGIAAEHLAFIFDRFYRVDRSRSSRIRHGAGLGLSICRTIAEAHNGQITISSEIGRGTTATLTLPITPRSQHSTSA